MDAFEKHIKNTFDQHELPVDTEELWKNVEPKLKKRRIPGFFFFLLIAGGLLTSLYLFSQNEEGLGKREAERNELSSSSVFGRKGQLINNIAADSQNNVRHIVEEKTALELTATPAKETKAKVKTNNKSYTKDKIFFPNDLVKENDEVAESIVNIKSPVRSSDLRTFLSTKKVATNTRIQPVISLSAPKIFAKKIEWKGKHPFNYSTDIFAGIGFSSKALQAKKFDHVWYQKERLATEFELESFQFGFQLNAAHKSGFLFGSGLYYHQVNEMFKSKNSAEIRYFVEGVVEIVTNADGSSTEVSGQKLVVNEKQWDKRKYNQYRFIQLPVYAGYSFKKGLFQYELTTGINVNLSFTQEGEILGQEGFPVSLSDPQNSIFSKNSSVDLIGGIKLLYPLNERFILYAEPNFQYNLFSITEDSYPLEQRYFHGGIRLGGRILL